MSLLEEEHGIPRIKLLPSSRLVHDLGVDGDDAADLFRRLHERFGTDFTALDEHWTEFFCHEGASPMSIPIGLALLVPAAASTVPVAAASHLPDPAAGTLGAAIFFGLWVALDRASPRERTRPVTIAGLAEIVRRGAWPADPADVR